jgi:hypothetical protein
MGLALPIGAIGWFELAYLFFGITGEDPPPSYNVSAAVAAFGVALAWPLLGTVRAAEVVRRSCRLGGIVTVLLPVVTIAVLLLWQSSTGRRDLGMGGLMLYSLPRGIRRRPNTGVRFLALRSVCSEAAAARAVQVITFNTEFDR